MDKEIKNDLNFAKRLKTDKQLLEMGFNFGNSDQLSQQKISETDVQNVIDLRDKSYRELAKRMERLNFLNVLYQKIDIKRQFR